MGVKVAKYFGKIPLQVWDLQAQYIVVKVPPQVIPTFPHISRQFSTFPDISRQFLTFPAQFFFGNVGKNAGQLAPNFLISHLISMCEN